MPRVLETLWIPGPSLGHCSWSLRNTDYLWTALLERAKQCFVEVFISQGNKRTWSRRKHRGNVCLAYPASFNALVSKCTFPVIRNVCFLFQQHWYLAESAAAWLTLSPNCLFLLLLFQSFSFIYSAQGNWGKTFHLYNLLTQNVSDSFFNVVCSQFHCLPDNFMVIDDICCCFQFVLVTWVFNSSNFIFDFVLSVLLFDSLPMSMMPPNPVGYKSYWNTNTTVQFEWLFYRLGQCFSSAFLFLDGFNLTVKNAAEEPLTCNRVAVKNASDLPLSAWACTRAYMYRFVGVFFCFSALRSTNSESSAAVILFDSVTCGVAAE